MSRIRSTHPGVWTDERFVAVSAYARLLFMGIWNECDDYGSFEWSPLKLKMRLLPADNVDANGLLEELIEAGSLLRYDMGGKAYGAVRNFCQYQRPKKPTHVHPQTEAVEAWVNTHARSTRDGSEEEGKELPTGGEKARQRKDEGGKGEEEKKEETPQPPQAGGRRGKTVLPEDWVLPPVSDLPPKARACAEQWTSESYETHGEAFASYWRSERKLKADWRGTWANRVIDLHAKVLRDQKFGNAPTAKPAAASDRPMTDAELRRALSFAEDFDNHDRAAELRRMIEERRAKPPPPQIQNLIGQATNGMRASH